MKIVPYEKFQIDTDLSSIEVAQRIRTVTGKIKLFSLTPEYEFRGRVSDSEFKIIKNILYRNSFLPIVKGKIEQKGTGTSVTISMRLHLLVMCFLSIWFSGVGLGCIVVISDLNAFTLPMLTPFGLLIFGVVLVSGSFWYEASKQKRRLIELLSKN